LCVARTRGIVARPDLTPQPPRRLRSQRLCIMRHSDWHSRWKHVTRGVGPLMVAICLTIVLPLLSHLNMDPGMTDAGQLGYPESIPALIVAHAKQYALDPALLQAVIQVESNFNPQAVSPKGALGLMQLMPLTAAALHVLDPFDPNDNIRAGAAILRRLLDRFGGNLPLALAAYHAGERRVAQAVSTDSLPATQLYVERVLRHYNRFVAEEAFSAVWAGGKPH
jgi:soluble lytic murein transglycosylase-like protein